MTAGLNASTRRALDKDRRRLESYRNLQYSRCRQQAGKKLRSTLRRTPSSAARRLEALQRLAAMPMVPQRLSGSRSTIVAGVAVVFALVLLASSFRSTSVQTIHIPDGKGALVKVDVALPPDFYDHSVSDFYKPYRDHMFAPWTCLDDNAAPDSRCRRPITGRAITALEYLASGGAYRIRYTGKDILYRPLQVFRLTYKVNRLEWIMNTIREMADEGMLTRTVNGVEGEELVCFPTACSAAAIFHRRAQHHRSPHRTHPLRRRLPYRRLAADHQGHALEGFRLPALLPAVVQPAFRHPDPRPGKRSTRSSSAVPPVSRSPSTTGSRTRASEPCSSQTPTPICSTSA